MNYQPYAVRILAGVHVRPFAIARLTGSKDVLQTFELNGEVSARERSRTYPFEDAYSVGLMVQMFLPRSNLPTNHPSSECLNGIKAFGSSALRSMHLEMGAYGASHESSPHHPAQKYEASPGIWCSKKSRCSLGAARALLVGCVQRRAHSAHDSCRTCGRPTHRWVLGIIIRKDWTSTWRM